MELAEESIHLVAQRVVAFRCGDVHQIFVERPDVVGDCHIVVVQHDEQVALGCGCVVESLKRQASGY